MKNPRKSVNKGVSTVVRGLKNTAQDLADLPVVIEPTKDMSPKEQHSPEEKSFRTLLHKQLSRHKAPQALRERIKKTIKTMPD